MEGLALVGLAVLAVALVLVGIAGGLVVIAVGAAVPAIVARRPLGFRVLRVGGVVPVRHAFVDPADVRLRLRRWMSVLAAPGLFAAPVGVAMAVTAETASRAQTQWATWPWIAASFALTAVALATLAVGAHVSRGLPITRVAAATPLAGAALATAWVATALTAWGGAGSIEGWIGLPVVATAAGTAVWMLGGLLVANDLRVVATWDRMCAARHRHDHAGVRA